jgi:hypothetical protein
VAPALELLSLYHERWEIELVLDEIKTHERAQRKVLRSKTPEGVRQELYGLFLAHYAVRLRNGASGDAGRAGPRSRELYARAVSADGDARPRAHLGARGVHRATCQALAPQDRPAGLTTPALACQPS